MNATAANVVGLLLAGFGGVAWAGGSGQGFTVAAVGVVLIACGGILSRLDRLLSTQNP